MCCINNRAFLSNFIISRMSIQTKSVCLSLRSGVHERLSVWWQAARHMFSAH